MNCVCSLYAEGIAEWGTHDELMARGPAEGVYANLVSLQEKKKKEEISE